MKLTKKRMRALNTALSLDDILYEKFRRLNEDLRRREEALHRKRNIIYSVFVNPKNGTTRALNITDVHFSPYGVMIQVEDYK